MTGEDEPALAALGPCAYCQQVILYDPTTVRSIHIDHDTGLPAEPDVRNPRIWREPLCASCVPIIEDAAANGGSLAWPGQRRAREN